jgi:hypothetical protein
MANHRTGWTQISGRGVFAEVGLSDEQPISNVFVDLPAHSRAFASIWRVAIAQGLRITEK